MNQHDTAILTQEYRGELLDLVHEGYICVVDQDGRLLSCAGNPQAQVYYRSASKPLQALPVIARDLDRKFGLTEEETAIFSGSHLGEDFHIKALESIFEKTGMDAEHLIMKPTVPGSAKANEARIQKGLPPKRLYHNCSGKHAALMLLQRELGGDIRDYWRTDSPAQQEVLRTLSILSQFPAEKFDIGIDGCGVPVFALPMQNMAVAFKNLACGDMVADPALRAAIARYVPVINRYPLMMRGTDYLCTLINYDKNLVAKGGANGVYGIGLKKERLGISLKIKDGADGAWPLVIAEIFRQIGYDNPSTLKMLKKLHTGSILNDNNTVVGHCKTVFKLSAQG